MRALSPAFGGPALLRQGDAIATTHTVDYHTWETRTYLGIVTERPRKIDGEYHVVTDAGMFPIRDTQTLAIWFDR